MGDKRFEIWEGILGVSLRAVCTKKSLINAKGIFGQEDEVRHAKPRTRRYENVKKTLDWDSLYQT